MFPLSFDLVFVLSVFLMMVQSFPFHVILLLLKLNLLDQLKKTAWLESKSTGVEVLKPIARRETSIQTATYARPLAHTMRIGKIFGAGYNSSWWM